MHLACRLSEQWLQRTFKAWLVPAARQVSTTSAIKRGLRATRGSRDGGSRGGRIRRNESVRGTQQDSGRELLPTRSDPGRRRDSQLPERRRRFSASPEQPPSKGHDAEGEHTARLVQLRADFRRVRRLDDLPNRTASDREPALVARLQQTIAAMNETPALLAQVRSHYSPTRLDSSSPVSPVLVRGASPPSVNRTALWLRPDNTFGLALPRVAADSEQTASRKPSGDVAKPDKPLGLASTVKRLRDLISEIQQAEKDLPDKPSYGRGIEEARGLIERTNRAMKTGSWAPQALLSFIRERMGRAGKLWSRSDSPARHTFLLLGNGNALSLVLRKQPSTAKSAERDSRAPRESPRGQTASQQQGELDGVTQSPRVAPHGQRATQQKDEQDDIPVAIPYTTAASDFLYGSNTVLAALRAQRRKLYHLYLHPRLSAREDNAKAIANLAKELNIRITNNADVRLLDRMSDSRPHNGVILEASRLPAPPLLSLEKPNRRTSIIPLILDRQSAEDVAVNGAPAALPTLTQTWRHPFVLMLDGVVDPGNVGNILRTAHFYGVDAVALATNTCAPLTSAALAKASSGACEALRIFALPRPSDFIYDSAKAGWQIYAAVAPADQRPSELRRPKDFERNLTTSALAQSSPLAQHPVILMLGAEGEGLRENLRKRANRFVTIEQGGRAFDGEGKGDVGVDSLNVGVAAGVLVEAFTRKPEGARELGNAGELGF